MMRVEEINRLEDLSPYRLRWQRLLGETRGATFFQSLDWLDCYLRHFGEGLRLRVLLVSHERRSLGILPLVVRTYSSRLGMVRSLGYPLDDWGSFFGPIGPNPTATLLAGLRHIRETPRDWDVIDLNWVQDTLDRGRTEHAMRRASLAPLRRVTAAAAMVEFETDWEGYLESRSRHVLKNLRRTERKLASAGAVEHVHYRPRGAAWGDSDPRFDLYDACEKIAGKSWQARSTCGGNTLSSTSVRDFLRDAHCRAAAAGAVDIQLLRVAGQPVAFTYGYHLAGLTTGLRMGFDAEFSRDGAGALVCARSLESCCRSGDYGYDLGLNYLHYKRNWLTRIALCERYTHYAPRPRPQLLRMKGLWQRWRSGAELKAGWE